MFNLEFIRNGDGFFTSEDYMIASEAEQHIRNISDYDDFYIASKEQSVKQVQNAKKIVEKVQKLLLLLH